MSKNPNGPKNDDSDALKVHSLASKLAKDAIQSGGIIRFKGYIGNSDSPDKICLYLSLDFDECLNIKRSDILHAEEIPEHELEFGGTAVWVRKDAEIQHVKTSSIKLQADILEGEISKAQLKPSITSAATGIPIAPATITPRCISDITCPSDNCPSDNIPCPSGDIPCPPSRLACPSRNFHCPSRLNCPSVTICPTGTTCPSRFIPCVSIRCPTLTGCQTVEVCPSLICPSIECPVNPPDPSENITAQIKELIDQIKAQNAQIKKLTEKD